MNQFLNVTPCTLLGLWEDQFFLIKMQYAIFTLNRYWVTDRKITQI